MAYFLFCVRAVLYCTVQLMPLSSPTKKLAKLDSVMKSISVQRSHESTQRWLRKLALVLTTTGNKAKFLFQVINYLFYLQSLQYFICSPIWMETISRRSSHFGAISTRWCTKCPKYAPHCSFASAPRDTDIRKSACSDLCNLLIIPFYVCGPTFPVANALFNGFSESLYALYFYVCRFVVISLV